MTPTFLDIGNLDSSMKVSFIFRKPYGNFFSIEELFKELNEHLKKKIETNKIVLPFENSGGINRLRNVFFACKNNSAITHITGDAHYLGIFLSRKRTVLTVHDCGEIMKQRGAKKIILWLLWFYLPIKRLKYITTISETTKFEILRIVKTNPDKIRVIPNCLIGSYNKKNLPFNKSCPRILIVGVTSNKNIGRIIEAIGGVTCELVFLGSPEPTHITLMNNCKLKYQIHINLQRSEVISLYSHCDFLLYPSLLEGFGLPIIEAQASGIPVITSNTGVMPHTAGLGALLVDPLDTEDIRKAVLRLIADEPLRKSLVENGFSNILRFQPEAVAQQYLDLYNEIEMNN